MRDFTLCQLPYGMLLGFIFGLVSAAHIPALGQKLKQITSFFMVTYLVIFGFIYDICMNYAMGVNFIAAHVFTWMISCAFIYLGVLTKLHVDKLLIDFYAEKAKQRREYSTVSNNVHRIGSSDRS